jgi:guanylate kinase
LTRIALVSGPSGAGKQTVLDEVRQRLTYLKDSVSVTTRAPRPGEIDGIHYRFISDAEFDLLVAENLLLESAVVHGTDRYGTPHPDADIDHLLIENDLQGARQVKAAEPSARLSSSSRRATLSQSS